MNRRRAAVVARASAGTLLGVLLGVYMPLWAMAVSALLMAVVAGTTAHLSGGGEVSTRDPGGA